MVIGGKLRPNFDLAPPNVLFLAQSAPFASLQKLARLLLAKICSWQTFANHKLAFSNTLQGKRVCCKKQCNAMHCRGKQSGSKVDAVWIQCIILQQLWQQCEINTGKRISLQCIESSFLTEFD